MHLSTFSARQIEMGHWVIDAKSNAGVVRQLAGVLTHKAGAERWLLEHPAKSFLPAIAVSSERPSIVAELQDVLSLQQKIERLERTNAWLKGQLVELSLLRTQLPPFN